MKPKEVLYFTDRQWGKCLNLCITIWKVYIFCSYAYKSGIYDDTTLEIKYWGNTIYIVS